jgi:hypothetical protein
MGRISWLHGILSLLFVGVGFFLSIVGAFYIHTGLGLIVVGVLDLLVGAAILSK